MLSIRTLFAVLYLLHLVKQDKILLLDLVVTFHLLEFTGPDLVLSELLFHLQIARVDNLLHMLHIVLMIYLIQTQLVHIIGPTAN